MRKQNFSKGIKHLEGATMALILDDNSEIGAHVARHLGYLICLRHLFRSKAVKILKREKKTLYHYLLHI